MSRFDTDFRRLGRSGSFVAYYKCSNAVVIAKQMNKDPPIIPIVFSDICLARYEPPVTAIPVAIRCPDKAPTATEIGF